MKVVFDLLLFKTSDNADRRLELQKGEVVLLVKIFALSQLFQDFLLNCLSELKLFWLLYVVLSAPVFMNIRGSAYRARSIMAACGFCDP